MSKIKKFWIPVIGMALLAHVSLLGNDMKARLTDSEVTVSEHSTADSIRAALGYQLEHYPASQYRDVYKNFMQDFFGPGHILNDTAASARYLRSELALNEPFEGPLYEPTGYKGNFYRVNLSLLRDSILPYPVFFEAFVESVQSITPPDDKTWMRTWETIDSIVAAEGYHFVNEEADRANLGKQFAEGDYIVHHSQRFNDSSRFHYRIISAPIFRTRILPYLHFTGV